MAPSREAVDLKTYAIPFECVQPTLRLIVDLNHHVRPQTKFAITADWPVPHVQDEVDAIGVDHAVVRWANETQSRLITLQLFAQLLHRARGGNFL
jgi:hypothetical protein